MIVLGCFSPLIILSFSAKVQLILVSLLSKSSLNISIINTLSLNLVKAIKLPEYPYVWVKSLYCNLLS